MKRLFGRDKGPKPVKSVQNSRELGGQGVLSAPAEEAHFYHQQQSQDRGSVRVSSDDHWDIISAHDGGSPHLHSYSPRAVSPFSMVAPAVPPKATASIKSERDLGILKALDPHPDVTIHADYSDEFIPESIHRDEKKERKGFWERASERSKEKEKEKKQHKELERREEDAQAELTRMIGYLTATSSEDWSLVLEVCERASSSEIHAKEAAKALRKEFKYADPKAQLSAARLWAIMLRNCSDIFFTQCSSRKFLDALEDTLREAKTTPVVRERLMAVLAGAAYASPSGGRHDKEGFRGLWRKVKQSNQPEEGIPFDTNDSMFTPPIPNFQEPPITTPPSNVARRPSATRHKSSRHRVIPPEEDMRRLFQECKVGSGNAALLSEALTFAKPEDLKTKDIIREFYARCRASQELICAQIPWASAGAERSRQAVGRGSPQPQKRTKSSNGDINHPPPVARTNSKDSEPKLTQEEQLLAALLKSNEELTEALRLYDDLERVGLEREAEERSRKETRIDRRQLYYDPDGQVHLEPPQPHYAGGTSSTPSPSASPSPSPAPSVYVSTASTNSHTHGHPLPQIPPPPPLIVNNSQHPSHISTPSLAPPPPAPHGPRQPPHSAVPRSRTPSPDRSSMTHSTSNYYSYDQGQYDRYHQDDRHRQEELDRYITPDERYHAELTQAASRVGRMHMTDSESPEGSEDDPAVPTRPSAKALGKRRVVAQDEPDGFDPDDLFYEHANDSRRSDDLPDDDSDSAHPRTPWHQPVHYVYDAAAERMKERLKEAHSAMPPTNTGVVH